MHYATKLKLEIEELIKSNNGYMRAIFDAQKDVLGKAPCISPFNDLCGNEESMPITNSDKLRKIILDLPLVINIEKEE